jgi:hypothetical protein
MLNCVYVNYFLFLRVCKVSHFNVGNCFFQLFTTLKFAVDTLKVQDVVTLCRILRLKNHIEFRLGTCLSRLCLLQVKMLLVKT